MTGFNFVYLWILVVFVWSQLRRYSDYCRIGLLDVWQFNEHSNVNVKRKCHLYYGGYVIVILGLSPTPRHYLLKTSNIEHVENFNKKVFIIILVSALLIPYKTQVCIISMSTKLFTYGSAEGNFAIYMDTRLLFLIF